MASRIAPTEVPTMSQAPSPGSVARRVFAWPPGRFPTGRVAVVRLYGQIGGGGRTAELVELLKHLRESRRVPAVVIDIDSPGGSATASDDLFLALRRLSAVKPVVAAIRSSARRRLPGRAGARRIVANPVAVVGSIGVVSVGPHAPDSSSGPGCPSRRRGPGT